MKREIKNLTDGNFDVLIVGAGIYGAAAAWDAALRGLRVAVIDKADFGGGTSANSLKTVHGGLRYLQQLDFKRMRESIRERRTLMGIAPHLVHPLPCIMPTYGHLMKGREAMLAGMILNDIVSFDRNRLGDPEKTIPRGRILSKKACLASLPGIDGTHVTGGAMWTDAQMFNSERVVLAFILSAVSRGAVAANYVSAKSLLRKGSRVIGVCAVDALTSEELEIRAKVVVNAAGGWIDRVLGSLGTGRERFRLSTAMNLVVNRRIVKDFAAGVYGRFRYPKPDGSHFEGRRVLFMAPWRSHTIVGTLHRPYSGDPDDARVTEGEIRGFLEEVNSAYPGEPVLRDEVSFFHKGFLPMDGIHPKTGDVVLTKHYRIFDHAAEEGIEGLISVAGVKYTTARDVSSKVVDIVFGKLRLPAVRSRSDREPLEGGRIAQFDDFLSKALSWSKADVEKKALRHLVYSYGSDYPRILRYGEKDGEWLRLLPGSEEVLRAEVAHAVEEEMAVRLSDVVLRRTDLGSGGRPGAATLQACAGIMADALGWTKDRIGTEVGDVNDLYEVRQ